MTWMVEDKIGNIMDYSETRCIVLWVLENSKKTHVYLHEFEKAWFVIRDWWISIRCLAIFQFRARID